MTAAALPPADSTGYYDRIAERYAEHHHPLFWSLADALLEALLVRSLPGDPGAFVDVGCGDGRWAAWFARRTGASVALLDPSEPMLRRARKRLRALKSTKAPEAIQGRACAMPFPDRTFDVALCLNNVIGLCDDAGAAMTEMARVCRQGARAAVGYCTPAAAARYFFAHGQGTAAFDMLQRGTCVAPWAEHAVRAFATGDLHRLAEERGWAVVGDTGFPRASFPHPDVERALDTVPLTRVRQSELEMLGTGDDALAHTRLLILERRGGIR